MNVSTLCIKLKQARKQVHTHTHTQRTDLMFWHFQTNFVALKLLFGRLSNIHTYNFVRFFLSLQAFASPSSRWPALLSLSRSSVRSFGGASDCKTKSLIGSSLCSLSSHETPNVSEGYCYLCWCCCRYITAVMICSLLALLCFARNKVSIRFLTFQVICVAVSLANLTDKDFDLQQLRICLLLLLLLRYCNYSLFNYCLDDESNENHQSF